MIGRENLKKVGDKFRLKLHHEDVNLDLDEFSEMGLTPKVGLEDAYYLFKEAIPHPDFNIFYRFKIKGTWDPYWKELLGGLIYLNKGISDFGLKQLAAYAIVNWIKFEDSDPVITNEQFCAHYRKWEERITDYFPTASKVVLFSRESDMSPKERKSIAMKMRLAIARYHADQLALNVVEYLADSDSLVKVSHALISTTAKEMLNVKLTESRSRKTESDRRKKRVQEVNVFKPFKTLKTAKKYQFFLKMGYYDKPVWMIAKGLEVSKTTALQFRELYEAEKKQEFCNFTVLII